MHHCSTDQQRVEWISQMIASPSEYGLGSPVESETSGFATDVVCWKAKGEQALQNALGAARLPVAQSCQCDPAPDWWKRETVEEARHGV